MSGLKSNAIRASAFGTFVRAVNLRLKSGNYFRSDKGSTTGCSSQHSTRHKEYTGRCGVSFVDPGLERVIGGPDLTH